MALSAPINGTIMDAAGIVLPGSARAKWFEVVTDAKGSASASTEPLAITQTGARWINVPAGATRMFIRAKWTAGETPGTAPVVSVWGADTEVAQGSTTPPTSAFCELIASAKTLGIAKVVEDDSWEYGAVTEIGDVLGMSAVLVHCTTAGAVTTTMTIQGKFLT